MTKTEIKLSEHIRKQTRSLHARLDHLPLLKSLIDKDIDNNSYEKAILYFYTCYSVWEESIKNTEFHLSTPSQLQIRFYATELYREMSEFDQTTVKLPSVPSFIPTSQEEYFGYSYVISGSAMGAQFILRNLENAVQLHGYNFEYFRAVTARFTSPDEWTHWKLEWSDYIQNKGFDHAKVIQASVECFSKLISWFELNDITFIQRCDKVSRA